MKNVSKAELDTIMLKILMASHIEKKIETKLTPKIEAWDKKFRRSISKHWKHIFE